MVDCAGMLADAMDVASSNPIQMGIACSPFTNFKMIMGVFDVGSMVMPAMFTSCNINLSLLSNQGAPALPRPVLPRVNGEMPW